MKVTIHSTPTCHCSRCNCTLTLFFSTLQPHQVKYSQLCLKNFVAPQPRYKGLAFWVMYGICRVCTQMLIWFLDRNWLFTLTQNLFTITQSFTAQHSLSQSGCIQSIILVQALDTQLSMVGKEKKQHKCNLVLFKDFWSHHQKYICL